MFSRISAWLIPAIVLFASLRGEEQNAWPLSVKQEHPNGSVETAEYIGPLFFNYRFPGEPHQSGFRPFYLKTQERDVENSYLFYPFFKWRKESGYSSFSFFELANESREHDAGQTPVFAFDVWPFYFSRDTGQPETSYKALFPIGGTIKQRLGYDRINFVLFPLYGDFVQKGSHTTHAPWPFLRFIHGAGDHGFEFWPLFGHRGRQGDYSSQFYLWPLIYKSAKNLSEPQPDIKLGVLPFYARETAPGKIDETFVWPFFGYSHQTSPIKYDEQRYFWPLFVQGRGDVSYINRWAPLYTHSVIKGYDKTWVAWPLFRHATWQDGGIAQEQNQVFFFLYWSLTQRSTTNPSAAPGHKTHLWPLFSSWNNGAGRRQLQVLSPFEVFFPGNEPIRLLYTPLFALYRFDQRAPNDMRHSVFFNLLTWQKSPGEKEFHFGPLLSRRSSAKSSRIVIGLGLFSWQRRSDSDRWKFSMFDFHSQTTPAVAAPLTP